MDTLYLVIPCYNEEEVLPETSKQLLAKMQSLMAAEKISEKSRIVFVNDGSKDRTWEIIQALHQENPIYQGVCLLRNRGHQNALLGGLMTVKNHCDMAISLDADLQDDIDAIDEMVDKYYAGNDVVYGVRNARKTDTFFKKFTAEGFYKVMKMMGADVVFNHADYRLMSRRALEALSQYGEVNLFLRGIVPLIGFRTSVVAYERSERFAGESKYPLKKMIAFAIQGITSFSTKPLSFVTGAGLLSILVAIGMFVYVLVSLGFGHAIAGWGSMMISIWLIGGLIMLSLGIVGEYVGKIYMESKHRPRYRIETTL